MHAIECMLTACFTEALMVSASGKSPLSLASILKARSPATKASLGVMKVIKPLLIWMQLLKSISSSAKLYTAIMMMGANEMVTAEPLKML